MAATGTAVGAPLPRSHWLPRRHVSAHRHGRRRRWGKAGAAAARGRQGRPGRCGAPALLVGAAPSSGCGRRRRGGGTAGSSPAPGRAHGPRDGGDGLGWKERGGTPRSAVGQPGAQDHVWDIAMSEAPQALWVTGSSAP